MTKRKKLGLYVHIPFCEKKCNYCDFLSFSCGEKEKQEYTEALIREIRGMKKKASEYEVQTIFIGGGTPSILPVSLMKKILKEIQKNFCIKKDLEYTVECNPKTLTKEKLRLYKEYGINRISLGLQSANDKELERMGRIHSFEDFLSTYEMVRAERMDNVSIDLIFGLPGQNEADWEKTLYTVAALSPEHISAYSLIIEEGTNFYKEVSQEELPSEEEERRMHHNTGNILKKFGYEQYEISNYAGKGKESVHNIGYWQRAEYMGLGLGASSLLQNVRYKNTDDLLEYISNSKEPEKIQKEKTILTMQEQEEEFNILGLRMIQGISESEFEQKFGKSFLETYKGQTEKFIKAGLMEIKNGFIRLTPDGIDVSNMIFSEFIEIS
jgi:oxygen-independent coproporphyrinogen-3 oxidase